MKVYVFHEQFECPNGESELYVAAYSSYEGEAKAVETIINDGEMLSPWQNDNFCSARDVEDNSFSWNILQMDIIDYDGIMGGF